MFSDDEFKQDEDMDEEGLFDEHEIFEIPPEENVGMTEAELQRHRMAEVNNLIKLLDHIPNRSMHERLRYRYNSQVNKIVENWMKEFNLRGLDYFHLMKKLLINYITRGSFTQSNAEKNQKMTRRRSLRKFFVDDKSSDSSSTESEPEVENSSNPCLTYLEEIKKECPALVESVKRKEEMRKERQMLDNEKVNKALEEFCQEKCKREAEKESKRMCYLEKKSTLPEGNLNLGDFFKKVGFPTPHTKLVSDEVFAKFNIDRESFERDYPLMDEEDLLKLYESTFHGMDRDKEEDEEDILGKRGRFPFTFPRKRVEGDEEGVDINLAKWEQEYWRHREEMEGKSHEKKKEKEEEMELCQVMLVRSGTSWKQELGYTEGWSDTTRLGKQGRSDMEEVAKKVMKRGYKFDYVLTSTLGRAWRSTDLVLSGSGQEKMIRNACWELNPRHRGQQESGTELGAASRWGWLSQEWQAFNAPPPIGPRESGPPNIARADPSLPDTTPRAENIFHVQLRVEGVWTLIRNMFLKGGKRTILVCAHKDSIEALLFQIYGFLPTDFTAWQPSYTTPIILMWYKKGEKLLPAFIDFLCDIEEADRYTENLTICWLERFVDQKLLDFKTLTEIKEKMTNGERVPDLRELWEERFIKSLRNLEKNAETIGQETRMMDEWLQRGYIVTPEEQFRVTEDNTVFKKFIKDLDWIDSAKNPLSDVLTLAEQIEWIIKREEMPLERKISNLRKLEEFLPENTDEDSKELLQKVLEEYEAALESEKLFLESINEASKPPEEKFAERQPETWADLKTMDDWYWAALHKKFPGGVNIPRKELFDDWSADSIVGGVEPEEEMAEEVGEE